MTTSNSASALKSASSQTAQAAQTDGPAPRPVPEEPLAVIGPGGARFALDFREVWDYRELLYFHVWRDVKVRYKQTLLGVVWVVLQPVLMMLIFTLFFGRLAGIESDGIPYPLFAYAGLLPWTFFAAAVNSSGESLVNSTHLVTKVYFPRIIVPLAAVGAAIVNLAISFGVLAVLMLYWRVAPARSWLMLPVLVVMLVAQAQGVGTLMSALNVKYRDIRLVLPFLIQVWFFASPIIYPLSLVPEQWRWLMKLNPMTGIIEGFRSALYGAKPFDWAALGFSAAATLALLAWGAYTFRRMEKSFADVV